MSDFFFLLFLITTDLFLNTQLSRVIVVLELWGECWLRMLWETPTLVSHFWEAIRENVCDHFSKKICLFIWVLFVYLSESCLFIYLTLVCLSIWVLVNDKGGLFHLFVFFHHGVHDKLCKHKREMCVCVFS